MTGKLQQPFYLFHCHLRDVGDNRFRALRDGSPVTDPRRGPITCGPQPEETTEPDLYDLSSSSVSCVVIFESTQSMTDPSFSVFLEFFFLSPCSRLNRNKLQFLPELLFQSNPKLGRVWVQDFIFPSMISFLYSQCYSLSLMCHLILLKTRLWCEVRVLVQVEGSGLLPGDTVVLCAPVERERLGCAFVCACGLKRWKCSCTECFAWTKVEFVFENLVFSFKCSGCRSGSSWFTHASHLFFFISRSQTFFLLSLSLSIIFLFWSFFPLSLFYHLCQSA